MRSRPARADRSVRDVSWWGRRGHPHLEVAMNAARFDVLIRSLITRGTRRQVVRWLTAVGPGATVASLLDHPDIAAGKHHRRHRKKHPSGSPGPCRAPGAACTRDDQCCAKVCLDNGFCGCFSQATGEIACPNGCRCDQVYPGQVGACVQDINVESCCATLPECTHNADCGRSGFCDASVCSGGLCMRRCPG